MATFSRRGLLAAAAALPLGGCLPPVYHTRYRLTLEVESPGGQFAGTSVFEQKAGVGVKGVVGRKVRGEATFVDLGPHGNLVALLLGAHWDDAGQLAPGYGAWMVEGAFMRDPNNYYEAWEYGTGRSPILETLARVDPSAPVELAPRLLPLLVHVRDPRDSRSVALVDPRDLAGEYGAGVRLRSARLQVTKDPMVSTIESRLPCVDAVTPGRKWQLIGPTGRRSFEMAWFKSNDWGPT